MIRTAGPQEHIVEEARDLDVMNFKFKDNEKPKSLVIYGAEALRVSCNGFCTFSVDWPFMFS